MKHKKILFCFSVLLVAVLLGCESSSQDEDGPDVDPSGSIVSTYNCIDVNDCTYSQYRNSPANESECECEFLCSGEVVNNTEADARDISNEAFCPDFDIDPANSCPVAGCIKACYELACRSGKCVADSIECN